MKITKEMLIAKSACISGQTWFLDHFPSGAADYQEVMDALASENRRMYAEWLVRTFSLVYSSHTATKLKGLSDANMFIAGDAVVDGDLERCNIIVAGSLTVEGAIVSAANILVAGRLHVRDSISCKTLYAMTGI